MAPVATLRLAGEAARLDGLAAPVAFVPLPARIAEANREAYMAKLRHIAVTVPDLEAAARFYENTFGMTRQQQSDIAILLSDGTVSLAILKFRTDEQAGDERGKDFHGLHHMGFVVDDIDAMSREIEANGGRYHMRLPDSADGATEIKFYDPNGVVFDIVTADYATSAWGAKVSD